MPRHTILEKKYRLTCPTCVTSRAQRFVAKKGVMCACGTNLGTPRCTVCNTPGDHPHQLNSGRWKCTACHSTFTYPKGRKTTSRRQNFTATKKTKKGPTSVTSLSISLRQMSVSDKDASLTSLESMLALMLFQKKVLDGARSAKFANPFNAQVTSQPSALSYGAWSTKMDVPMDLLEKTSPASSNTVSRASHHDFTAICSSFNDQDSCEEIRSSSGKEMISESFDTTIHSDVASCSDEDDECTNLFGFDAPVSSAHRC